ncbi:RlmE family RNA methyltransferase [Anaplasmataceae bacterium AB001_6]|nr:RlmE family RNA methyltransferase [Anaplasmataceae bacterium AB001_6]
MQRKSEPYSGKDSENLCDSTGEKNRSKGGYSDNKYSKEGDRPRRPFSKSGSGRPPFKSNDRFATRKRFGDKDRSEGGYSDDKYSKEGDRPRRPFSKSGSGRPPFKSNDRFATRKRFGDKDRSEGGYSDDKYSKEGDRPRRPFSKFGSDRPPFKSNDRFATRKRFGDKDRSEGGYSDDKYSKEGDRPRRPFSKFGSDRPPFKSNDRFATRKRFGDKDRSEGGYSDDKYSKEGDRPRRPFSKFGSDRPPFKSNDRFATKRYNSRTSRSKDGFFAEDVRSRLDAEKKSLIIKDDRKENCDEKRKYSKDLFQDRLKISSLDNKKKRTDSSTKWISRHINDPYVKSSKKEDYRSRAAYKLLEISEKINMFDNATNVVDLGSAPGSWAQVITRYSKKIQNVVAIDKINMDPIEGVQFIQFDLENNLKDLHPQLPVEKFDIILSDMGPNSCGNTSVDHIRSINLCYAALNFSCEFLKENGTLIFKMLQGSLSREFVLGLRDICEKVVHIKPEASRGDSREIYICLESFNSTEAIKYAESLNIKNNEENNEKNIDDVISALSN